MPRVTYHCKVCGHTWHPRKAETPGVCPKCHSAFWDVGAQRASRAEAIAKARAKREIEQKILNSRIPVSSAMRAQTYKKMGIILPQKDRNVTLGTTNAGPWLESSSASELPKVGMLDLFGFNDETDTLFVVNEQENSGVCLSGDGIFPGDVIHFRKGIQPNNGDIVLAEGFDVNGQWFVTAKHWHMRGLRQDGLPIIELRPSNPSCKIIRVFPQNVLEISVEITRTHRNLHKRRRKGR